LTAPVYIVHSIDAEGPLYESLAAKFERLEELFGVTGLEPTKKNLGKLQRGEIDLGGQEKKVQDVFTDQRARHNETWTEVDAMLERVLAPEFRGRLPDSNGNGWVYSWFCLDIVNYRDNPRRRDIGYHNIFDHYRQVLADDPTSPDALFWHYHPMSTYRDAHRCATHYLRTDDIFQILCRKIIERDWFPSVFRAGFQAERPDSHWFAEQWFPFDLTNMALDDNSELDATIDLRNGRSGDWRLAPADWSIYRPSHDDYQVPGDCRRSIGRSLNVLSRIASIDQPEVDKAFARAAGGAPTLMSVCSHDHRDFEPEVEHLRGLIASAARKFPDVKFEYTDALSAFRKVLWPDGAPGEALDLELTFHPAADGDVPFIEVATARGQVFGPQPFLAIETRSRNFIHDNLDFSPCRRRWFYAFHGDTLPLDDVARIGVAAGDAQGNVCVRKLDFRGDQGHPCEPKQESDLCA